MGAAEWRKSQAVQWKSNSHGNIGILILRCRAVGLMELLLGVSWIV